MAEEAKNIINIDGKEYNPTDMSEEQRYFIAQIRDLQVKANQAKFHLDQQQVALNFFTNKLIESLNQKEEKKVS